MPMPHTPWLRISLSGSDLAKDICKIDKNYSNDSRHGTDKYKGPCTGKNQGRFNIGENWRTGDNVSTQDRVFLPPRREHMCTSNLEKIHDDFVTNNGNVNDTFLVDVLLAAKEEAEFIKKTYEGNNGVKYKDKNGLKDDQVTTCRAIKSSFADIGDIIRGRDLWDKDSGSTEMEATKNITVMMKTTNPHINY
ncbi:hypothetical protein PFMC_05937 [Plasmodium falciparum CAMP/Malaysia]|uniref:Duffy-antigen binding domain-containing protein n=1 Tax=Plasmodium falciparum (isolate Camp / Malaysia) TaxID=5835 RepID=A0A024WYM4_PLAFC|nr:hypothetical protein PFMC_05937 [Plasmodium falciparum CAMP/Malaysia]